MSTYNEKNNAAKLLKRCEYIIAERYRIWGMKKAKKEALKDQMHGPEQAVAQDEEEKKGTRKKKEGKKNKTTLAWWVDDPVLF